MISSIVDLPLCRLKVPTWQLVSKEKLEIHKRKAILQEETYNNLVIYKIKMRDIFNYTNHPVSQLKYIDVAFTMSFIVHSIIKYNTLWHHTEKKNNLI